MKFGESVGHFLDVHEDEYHALKIPSNSSVKLFEWLPALYEVEYLKAAPQEDKQHFQVGKAFELMVLEPEKVSKIKTFSAKSYDSVAYHEACTKNPDCVIVSEADLAHVGRWAGSWEKSEKRFERTKENVAQVSCIVEIPTLDIPVRFKMRCDDVDFDNRIIYDYKLVKSAHPTDFQRAIWDFGYDVQAAMYLKGMSILFPDGEPWRFVFCVQEKHNYGYDSRFSAQYDLDSLSLEAAWAHVYVSLQLIHDKQFRGYNSGQLNTEKYRKWAT